MMKGRTRERRILLIAAVFLAVAATIGATASISGAASSWESQLNAAVANCRGPAPSVANLYQSPQIRDWMRNATTLIPVIKSPWGSAKTSPIKLHKPPWKIGFTNSYAGNSARQEVIKALHVEFDQYKKAGLVSSLTEFLSNGNVTTHISQMEQLVREHVDGIIDLSPSPTATSPAVTQAFKAGIPVIGMDAPLTSPYAITVSTNLWPQGVNWTEWMVRSLKGKGNVIMVDGIPGEAGNTIWVDAEKCVLKGVPGIKVVAEIPGMWTESVTKTAVLRALTAHPENIDGVLTQGPEATGVLQAFIQANRTPPLYLTSFGAKSTLAYWHAHKGKIHIHVEPEPPRASTMEAWRVLIRMLSGQRPILNTFYNVPAPIDDSNLDKYWKPTYKFGFLDDGFAEPTQVDWMPKSLMDKYFYNGGQNCPTSPLLKGPMFPC
jgi:ribose transport system substrate-binding protein